jgi:hypothetical protein
MTSASILPLDPKQGALVRELTALKNTLSDFQQALRPVNDEVLNEAFREIIKDADQIVGMHLPRPGVYIADDVANLRSLFVRRHIPREDPDLGNSPSLTALRSARGSVLADLDSALHAARSLGLVPSDPRLSIPAGEAIERAGHEGQLAALERRLRKVERDLETKIAPEGRLDEGRSLQQTGLVNFYVDAMKIELTLAKLEAKARELIDLTSLARSIEAIGELTKDFVATVQGLQAKVTDSLKRAAQAMRPAVRRVVGGLRTMVTWVRRSAEKSESKAAQLAEENRRDLPQEGHLINTDMVPDWPIFDLFHHIEVLEFENWAKSPISTIRAKVRTRLSTGELVAWGRQIEGSLAEIPQVFWKDANFMYWRGDGGLNGAAKDHARPVAAVARTGIQYADIRVNKAQALRIWPVQGTSAHHGGRERRFQVGDAVRFRAQTRVRPSFDIAADEVGTVVGVEQHPPLTGPTYRMQVQFPRALVPYAFSFEYELVEPAPREGALDHPIRR